MAVNVLRAAELLSDDSNFKPGLIQLLAREVAQLLCMDPATFKSRWCAGGTTCRVGRRNGVAGTCSFMQC